ncbi:MAG: UvrD-helicase domain-containing protein [Psychroflexus sp.]
MEENVYLKTVLSKINQAIQELNEQLRSQQQNIRDTQAHLQEHKRDMDHLEKNNVREAVDNMMLVGDNQVEKKKRLHRLKDIAYFGRFDFREKGKTKSEPIYVGVHNFLDDAENKNLVYDWRAPISSMFYDFELGAANYDAKNGRVEGEIDLKRQFRIRNGELEYMLESDLTIQDDVLQKELNQASSKKMKNIVATIQREQNKIIRNENAQNLIIQGVAGSGKTSIALHRIAFLLYKFKDSISSEDMLIISPNKVFASYISNVLPELGEESVAETSMEELAERLLEHQIKFQAFFDQVAELLENKKPKLVERIQFKSNSDFIKRIDEFILYLENERFQAETVFVNKKPVPDWFIKETFEKYSRLPLLKRFNQIVEDVVHKVFIHYKYEVKGKERTELHKRVKSMFPSTNLRMLYKLFYEWLERPEMLKMRKHSTYEYADVYPLIYLKIKLEGIKPFSSVKHLVIDEMQDYSAIQYKVLLYLYPCKKTILGDINQSVNPFSSSNLNTIEKLMPNAESMTMLKSYRSTFEITEFTKRISKNIAVEPLERHGDVPQILKFSSAEDEFEYIKSQIHKFKESGQNSFGIICKTQTQADELYSKLKPEVNALKLLDATSIAFEGGVVITTAHLAKGLEFDWVLVPFASAKNYKTEPDRQMLYVACTRAMHKLNLTHQSKLTNFLEN